MMRQATTSATRTDVAAHSTVSTRVLRALVDAIERGGICRQSLFGHAQVALSELRSPEGRISRVELYRLCESAVALSGNAALGFRSIENLLSHAANPLSGLMYHAADVRGSMNALQRFHQLLADDIYLRIEESEDEVTLRCVPLVDAPLVALRFVSEMLTVALFRSLQALGAATYFVKAGFSYSRPSYSDEYERAFSQSVLFEQSVTCLVFERAVMDLQLPLRDADLHRVLCDFSERRLRDLNAKTSFASRVHRVLLTIEAPRRVEMERIAQELGMSERSLRRRLLQEGTCFAEVCDAALSQAAELCLIAKGRSIQETAVELGFADKAAFHRAFKRWTGATPQAFRLANQRRSRMGLRRDY